MLDEIVFYLNNFGVFVLFYTKRLFTGTTNSCGIYKWIPLKGGADNRNDNNNNSNNKQATATTTNRTQQQQLKKKEKNNK